MRNFRILSVMTMLLSIPVVAQVTVFSDNFETVTTPKWIKTGSWGTTTSQKHGGNQSMTDSPLGLYGNNISSEVTMASGVALDSAMDAQLSFWAIYDLENGFDYAYVEVSKNNGISWTTIATFNGEGNLTPWVKYTYSLGGFLGFNNVKIRFRFFSDPGYTVDGIYIDDVVITKDTVDKSPPLILHTAPEHYLSSLGAQFLEAELIDTSGISIGDLIYTVDGGPADTIHGIQTIGDKFAFNVPPQPAGSWVDYYFMAADTVAIPNVAFSDTFHYITGNHIYYDNGVVSFVNSFGPSATSGLNSVSVRATIPGTTQLVTALIRNYTDVNNPNDSILVHIWQNSGGVPGTDLVTPIKVFPEADLLHPHIMTRVDLRPFASTLSGISGDVFVGFSVPSGSAWTQYTASGPGNRSYTQNISGWSQASGADYHFRLVTDFITGSPIAGFTMDTVNDPTIQFTDTSKNSPNDWRWEFGDGSIDSIQHPSHTYLQNGIYQVCLTASNAIGSDKTCQFVVIRNVKPIADFGYNLSNDPIVAFTDFSLNGPTNWEWNFGDGSAIDFNRHPIHQFDSNKTYQVCLKAYNSIGSDSTCKNISINGYVIPVADFGFEQINNSTYQFSDSSSNNPTAWVWSFGNGKLDSVQNPNHSFTANGNFGVCLVASNGAGSSLPACKTVTLTHVGIESQVMDAIKLYPNPAKDLLFVEWQEANDNSYIIITDMLGKELIRTRASQNGKSILDIQQLKPGNYLITLLKEDQMILRKMNVE